MDNQARAILGQLLRTRGAELVRNSVLMEGLLMMTMAGKRRELNVLLGSLHEEIPAELDRIPARVIPGETVRKLAKRLEDHLALRTDAAEWAVVSWALALGKRVDGAARRSSRPRLGFPLPTASAAAAASAQAEPPSSPRARQLKTRQAVEVRRRSKGSRARWDHWGRTPGTVPLPDGYEYSFEKLSANDENLKKLAADLADAGLVAGLNLHSGSYSDSALIEFLSLPFLSGLRELNLEATRTITDAVLEAVGRLFPELVTLKLNARCYITDEGLHCLQPLARLEELNLSYCPKITDAGLAYLKSIPSLRRLHLGNNAEITDAGLEHLSALPGLKHLHLGDSRITDAGLQLLGSYPALTYLDLSSNRRVTDAGLAYLGSLSGLTGLNLMGCSQVTDEGLKALESLASLERLRLDWIKAITSRGMVSVGRLASLKILSLRECENITDEGLRPLAGLRDLRELDLVGCKRVTDDGLICLRALENLEVLKLSGNVTDLGLVPLVRGLPRLKDLWLLGDHQVSRTGETQIRRPGLDIWIPRYR